MLCTHALACYTKVCSTCCCAIGMLDWPHCHLPSHVCITQTQPASGPKWHRSGHGELICQSVGAIVRSMGGNSGMSPARPATAGLGQPGPDTQELNSMGHMTRCVWGLLKHAARPLWSNAVWSMGLWGTATNGCNEEHEEWVSCVWGEGDGGDEGGLGGTAMGLGCCEANTCLHM